MAEVNTRQRQDEYRDAFKDWTVQVRRARVLKITAPDSALTKEAEQRARAAEAAYRESRDRLAEELGEHFEPLQAK